MSLPVAVAEKNLRGRFGEPVKPPTQYVVGFKTPVGRVVALHREAGETRIWFQAPAPPPLEGVTLMQSSAKNSNLDGPLAVLNAPGALRVEVDGESALRRFLDWYDGRPASLSSDSKIAIDPTAFREAFARFQQLMVAKSGHRFISFHEGLAAVWENYKPRLRDKALELLAASTWSEAEINSGAILQHAIQAIEIQDSRGNLTNNLVFWQNRFGHASRDHRALLEAAAAPKLRRDLEQSLFDLYRRNADEAPTFKSLSELTDAKYPLIAYFYFLKDMDRFMPIHPTGFDRAFRALHVDFSTLRQCSWENYATYNQTLDSLRPLLEDTTGLKNVRLIDAHSFCWVFATLLKQEAEGSIGRVTGEKDQGRIVGGREKSIIAMRWSVENTAGNSNGQIVQRTLKNKDLRMTPAELEKLIASLLDLQNNRCALTGIPFQFHGSDADKNLLPSVDRIDSDGHYEVANLQIVCQFINFWKGDTDNEEFRRLLMLVRGEEAA